jgi:hypothetical protein
LACCSTEAKKAFMSIWRMTRVSMARFYQMTTIMCQGDFARGRIKPVARRASPCVLPVYEVYIKVTGCPDEEISIA